MNERPRMSQKPVAVGIVLAAVLWLVLAALLVGCATAPEPVVRVETQPVTIPVARSCVPAGMAAAPEYADSDAALRAAPAAEDRYQLVTIGRQQRIARLAVVEPVLDACK